MAAERHDAAFIVGAVVGGLAGAAGALWLAPQAGARTRAQLAERWNDAAEKVAQGVAGVDDRARGLLGRDDDAPVVVVTPPVDGTIGMEATVDGVIVLEAEAAPGGPRPGPIVGGTVVADRGASAAGAADPFDAPVPPVSPRPEPGGGSNPG